MENDNAGGTMKNHWQDRQSEILPDHTAFSTANVSSAVIEDDDAEVLMVAAGALQIRSIVPRSFWESFRATTTTVSALALTCI